VSKSVGKYKANGEGVRKEDKRGRRKEEKIIEERGTKTGRNKLDRPFESNKYLISHSHVSDLRLRSPWMKPL
jgi:hypothetical protein